MRQKLLRVLILSISVLSILGVVVGCDDLNNDTLTDSLSIMTKPEYQEKFLAHEFSVEDFQWANVERIEHKWYHENYGKGTIIVYLKKHSKKRVQDAKKHFEKLAFVDSVSFRSWHYID